jgi:translation initiation factor 2 beta subunit (eIF-2beta)/eIF-5
MMALERKKEILLSILQNEAEGCEHGSHEQSRRVVLSHFKSRSGGFRGSRCG